MKFTLLVLPFFLILISCETKVETEKIENIVRIFMHETNHYSFLSLDQNSKELKQSEYVALTSVKIFADVPEDQKIWAEYKDFSGFGGDRRLEIHIHGANDIDGGGWDKGKHGRGQTQVLELEKSKY